MPDDKFSLEDFLARCADDDGQARVLESTFGTTEPRTIVDAVENEVERFSGEAVSEWLFAQLSNGLAAIPCSTSGKRLFVKVHRPDVDIDYLARVRKLQDLARRNGWRCAQPLSALVPFRDSVITVDEYYAPRSAELVRNRRTRKALASGLAEFTDFLTAKASLSDWPSAEPLTFPTLWPPTDHPRFASVVRESHPWLDDVAKRAVDLLEGRTYETCISHMDWRMENVCVWGSGITAIYDWDAVFAVDECNAAGTAAVLHTINWKRHAGPAAPKALVAFLAAYESSRIRPMSDDERSVCVAYALYAICVVAKHNYATDPDGREWRGSAREYVKRHGDELLKLVNEPEVLSAAMAQVR